MENKTITFITLHDSTLRDIINQCYELGVTDNFNVEGRTIAQLAYLPITDSSLIVASSDVIVPSIKPYNPNKARIIVARRNINHANIRKILEIPRGMKVLLVNDSKGLAVETIELLQEWGIDLDFVPYYPGVASYPPDITIAVTPGEARFVPAAIAKVIDIGSRIIDFATWIEIAGHFNYEAPNLSRLISRYVNTIVAITKELNDEIQKTNLLRKYLEVVVDFIEDGGIAIDEEDIIRVTNHKALEILHLQGRSIIDQKAADCLQHLFYQLICQLPFDSEEVLNWENQSFFFRKTHILIEGRNYGSLILFRRASEINKLEQDYRRKQMSKGLFAKYTFDDLAGVSSSIKKLGSIAKKMAKGNSTIILLGETGTGKELLAQAIHNASPRRWEPFVGVNFAAISETLLESELFGYEEGAFTGSRKGGHIGLFEQAHKGTIFLDEIGDASAVIQNRLLRVLQEREIMKVGGNRIIPVDIRVIAATNRKLEEMVRTGLFRADLYYRLNVLPLHVPPLRERKEDIPLLADKFIRRFCHELRRPVFQISPEAMNNLLNYDWPGNIRELENVIQYLAHIAEDVVWPRHLLINRNESGGLLVDDGGEQELEPIYQAYVNSGFIGEIKTILEIIGQADHAVGRNYVISRMQADGRDITEPQLRYRMQLLKKDKLLAVGRARQGSVVTPKGRGFLQYIQKY